MRHLAVRSFSAMALALSGCVGAAVAQPAPQSPSPAASAAAPEIRGTWLTTTANDALSTPQKTAETMRRLREIGLNVVYVEAWKNGYTEFPSQTMERFVGVPMKINNTPAHLQRDLLKEAVIEAHRNGLLAIAWLEYGFMASYKDTQNELRARGVRDGFLTTNLAGEIVGKQNAFVWMNPLHPVPQQLVLDITLEAVRNYDLDGVQLDDRIAMPVEMGYDPFTRELYAKEHGGAAPPDNHRDPAWTQWRADKITEYARRYAAEIRRANPDLIISVSPAPFPWSLENYACDWPKWTQFDEASRWDEYVPQNYRMNFERTKVSIQECIDAIPQHKQLLAGGIRVVGDGPDMPPEDLLNSIRFTREAGIGGHVLWFSRGVLEVYPQLLQDFYAVEKAGPAPHPLRPGRRMPSIPAQRGNDGWTVTAPAGQDRFIAILKRNGAWDYGPTVEAGQTLKIPLADDLDAVEILVDRRRR
jgi:uncharacterized lipoprotein YddW (UPF0748 family)